METYFNKIVDVWVVKFVLTVHFKYSMYCTFTCFVFDSFFCFFQKKNGNCDDLNFTKVEGYQLSHLDNLLNRIWLNSFLQKFRLKQLNFSTFSTFISSFHVTFSLFVYFIMQLLESNYATFQTVEWSLQEFRRENNNKRWKWIINHEW